MKYISCNLGRKENKIEPVEVCLYILGWLFVHCGGLALYQAPNAYTKGKDVN